MAKRVIFWALIAGYVGVLAALTPYLPINWTEVFTW